MALVKSSKRLNRPAGLMVCLLVTATLLVITGFSRQGAGGLRFEVTFPASVRSEAVTGRMFLIITSSQRREPRLQVSRRGAPFFGVDVEDLLPGEAAVIDATTLGSPVENLRDIPPGEYFVQAMLSIYTKFERTDGHTLWMHMDQWEGQNWRRSPGNIYSDVKKIFIDPMSNGVVRLEVTNMVPPTEMQPDTEWVNRFRIQSRLLTEFWGYPIYIGATIQLPKGYGEHPGVYYPTVYRQGHFSTRAPVGFEKPPDSAYSRSRQVYEEWTSEDFPRMLVVTFQHPCPYYDDSYAVNSVNVGPYGDAIMQELIPEVERRFRCIRKPYARVLTGGSTGGWESLALQVWHPDFFGGTWSFAPDPVDFRNVEGINIYEDRNAFYKEHEWARVPIANTRNTLGEVRFTSRQRNYFELVMGTKGRSGEQLDIWSAVYGPLGDDGYFKPLFNKRTGDIDPEVAQYWKENYDIRHYLETNWSTVGEKLVGKLHIICGDMDNFYLNVGCYYLEEFLESTTDPYYDGSFTFGARGGHGYRPEELSGLRLYRVMADHITKHAPPGEDTSSWKYRASVRGQEGFEEDTFQTSAGDLKITFVGHGTLMFTFGGKVIHIDPVSRYADYDNMPKADLILITHEHGDHLDAGAIKAISTEGTKLVYTQICADRIEGGMVMANGDVTTVEGLRIEAIPAYNIVHERSEGVPFHPKGNGNGYLITFGDKRVYVAGDSENTPEMKALRDIDIAFLPMNLPYTMTPEMVADAAKAFRPKILYPYHFGNTDTSELIRLLEGEDWIEVRIRDLR